MGVVPSVLVGATLIYFLCWGEGERGVSYNLVGDTSCYGGGLMLYRVAP